jgi:hypothetical protein
MAVKAVAMIALLLFLGCAAIYLTVRGIYSLYRMVRRENDLDVIELNTARERLEESIARAENRKEPL